MPCCWTNSAGPSAFSTSAANSRTRSVTCARPQTWLDGFHNDIKRIDVPVLVLHGTADRILSIEGQGRRMHAALPDAHYAEIEGGPHLMCLSHAEEVNRELLAFLASQSSTR